MSYGNRNSQPDAARLVGYFRMSRAHTFKINPSRLF